MFYQYLCCKGIIPLLNIRYYSRAYLRNLLYAKIQNMVHGFLKVFLEKFISDMTAVKYIPMILVKHESVLIKIITVIIKMYVQIIYDPRCADRLLFVLYKWLAIIGLAVQIFITKVNASLYQSSDNIRNFRRQINVIGIRNGNGFVLFV